MNRQSKRKFKKDKEILFTDDDCLLSNSAKDIDDSGDSTDEDIDYDPEKDLIGSDTDEGFDQFASLNISEEDSDEESSFSENDDLNLDEYSDEDTDDEVDSDDDGEGEEWEDVKKASNSKKLPQNLSQKSQILSQKSIVNENSVSKQKQNKSNITKKQMPKPKVKSDANKKVISTKIKQSPRTSLPKKKATENILSTKDKSKTSSKTTKSLSKKKDIITTKTTSDKSQTDNQDNDSIKHGLVSSLMGKDHVEDEYEYDSSDEEDLRNTIGNIPLNWYDEYDHLGYGLDGVPIKKPQKGDALDSFLQKLEDPDFRRTVFDKQTGGNVKLDDEQLDLVQRIMSFKVPSASFDMYAPFHDLYSHEVMDMPLSGRPDPKRSFLPSKHEREKVLKIARMIRQMRSMKRKKKSKKNHSRFYDLWKPRTEDHVRIRGVTSHIPAPKLPTPGHVMSYNPPPEYLMNIKDVEKLEEGQHSNTDVTKSWRRCDSVRQIPNYPHTLKERFARLMNLYLAPRIQYKKVTAKAEEFLPELPSKKDLRPYPTLEGLRFQGHMSIVRTISVHPMGKYLASGSDDKTVKVWEISTGRCVRTFLVGGVVKKISWNPNPKLFLLGIAIKDSVMFMNPESYLTDNMVVQQTNSIFQDVIDQGDYIASEKVEGAVTWRKPTEEEWGRGIRVVVDHFKEVKEFVWHKQGDYFASVIPDGNHRSVIVHQLSRWRSQLPFRKNKGRVQAVQFHPKAPHLFVSTQTHIRLYDLKRQTLLKKVKSNSRWISSLAVHPGGEHFIVSGYDRKLNWFEMECTTRPHMLRYHTKAVRAVNFHRKYPLFASCSDDKLVVVHSTVYDDWLKDPLLIPLKKLIGHRKFDDLLVLDVAWHPYEPYLFSAGADGTIRLWH